MGIKESRWEGSVTRMTEGDSGLGGAGMSMILSEWISPPNMSIGHEVTMKPEMPVNWPIQVSAMDQSKPSTYVSSRSPPRAEECEGRVHPSYSGRFCRWLVPYPGGEWSPRNKPARVSSVPDIKTMSRKHRVANESTYGTMLTHRRPNLPILTMLNDCRS